MAAAKAACIVTSSLVVLGAASSGSASGWLAGRPARRALERLRSGARSFFGDVLAASLGTEMVLAPLRATLTLHLRRGISESLEASGGGPIFCGLGVAGELADPPAGFPVAGQGWQGWQGWQRWRAGGLACWQGWQGWRAGKAGCGRRAVGAPAHREGPAGLSATPRHPLSLWQKVRARS